VTERSATFTWSDPAELAALATSAAGLDWLERVRNGELPMPTLAQVMGFRLVDLARGRVEVVAAPTDAWCNPGGLVSGGFVGALLDESCGWAAASSLGAGRGAVTLSATTRYLRAVWPGSGDLRCSAEVRTRGRRVVAVDARVVDPEDRELATMASTFLVIELAGAAAEA
jgi:uncharacterized protein (TIGR00369 family)